MKYRIYSYFYMNEHKIECYYTIKNGDYKIVTKEFATIFERFELNDFINVLLSNAICEEEYYPFKERKNMCKSQCLVIEPVIEES